MQDGSDRKDNRPAFSRRGFLRAGFGLAAAATVLDPLDAFAQRLPISRPRVISLLNVQTGERLNNVEYWSRGRYQLDAVEALSRLMRDHRTDTVHPIEPELFDLVHSLQQRMGHRGPIHMISGYRSPETQAMLHAQDPVGAASNSFHTKGQAMDLRIPGVPTRTLYRAAITGQEGGVGFYPRTDFLHLDVGPVRTWVPGGDPAAAPAKRTRNAQAQASPPQVRTGRVQPLRPAEARRPRGR
ncbi:MAG TPA: DUF882 domain-containing protein [Azospirillaceae bacterium]|nr:DUF882 domain-containing protein [Azospirillaceae bacterium]